MKTQGGAMPKACQHQVKVEGMNANPYGIFGGVARLAGVAHFCLGLNPVRALRYIES